MDNTDQKLISALRRNSRASISQLAAELRVTRATVRTRLGKLQTEGEIQGFTIIVKGDTRELPVRGMTLIEIEGKGTDRIIGLLNGMPELQTIYTTNGHWDLIVEIGTQSLSELEDVLRRIRLIDGVASSETNLYLATKRKSHVPRAHLR